MFPPLSIPRCAVQKMGMVFLVVLPLVCAFCAFAFEARGKVPDRVIGIADTPSVYEARGKPAIGVLDSVYSASPAAYEVLGRETGWVRIRFAGKPAWVRAKDVLSESLVLGDAPYRAPLLCPDGLPTVFYLKEGNKARTFTVQRKATLAGGRGSIRVMDENNDTLWTSADDAVMCAPGQIYWPMVVGELSRNGTVELLFTAGTEATAALAMELFHWTGKGLAKAGGTFYAWQSGEDASNAWPLRDSPVEGEDPDKTPPLYRYVSELYRAHFDGSFEALVKQEDKRGTGETVTTQGVALFRLSPDGTAFVLQQWVIPLK